jgi:hypothetical protein
VDKYFIYEKVYKGNRILYVMEKRGLSNLVATVLIILLALAAVALVWSFLQPSFENTGVKIDLGTQCLNVDIKPLSCVFNTTADNKSAMVNVQYSNGDVEEVIIVVDWDGVTNVNRAPAPTTELQTEGYAVDPPTGVTGTDPTTASVAAVVTDGVNVQTCPESATKVNCEYA